MQPRVSVIVRTYNRAGYLVEAIESVFAQTFHDLELIVVDDGSTDQTAAVLDRYAGRLTPVFLGGTGNPAAGFNAGIGVAQGELIAFLDSDDLWLPDKMKRQVACLDRAERFGFAYSNACLLYPDGRRSAPVLAPDQIVAGSVLRAIVRNMCIHTSTVMVRRRCLNRVGPFDESRLTCEEFFWFLRLARAADAVCVAEPLALIRQHAGQLSIDRGLTTYQAAITALEELLSDPALPWRVRLEAHRSIARYHAHLARKLGEDGRAAEARRQAVRALWRYPLHAPAWRWALADLTRGAR